VVVVTIQERGSDLTSEVVSVVYDVWAVLGVKAKTRLMEVVHNVVNLVLCSLSMTCDYCGKVINTLQISLKGSVP
jgi:hypothetical protein